MPLAEGAWFDLNVSYGRAMSCAESSKQRISRVYTCRSQEVSRAERLSSNALYKQGRKVSSTQTFPEAFSPVPCICVGSPLKHRAALPDGYGDSGGVGLAMAIDESERQTFQKDGFLLVELRLHVNASAEGRKHS